MNEPGPGNCHGLRLLQPGCFIWICYEMDICAVYRGWYALVTHLLDLFITTECFVAKRTKDVFRHAEESAAGTPAGHDDPIIQFSHSV